MMKQAGWEGNQVKRPSYLGLMSALLALAGYGALVLSGAFKHISWLGSLGGVGFYLLELVALSVALIGAIRATRHGTTEGDRSLIILGGGLALVLIVFVLRPVVDWHPGPRAEIAAQRAYGANLEKLGEAMAAYSRAHNGRYPDPEKWCDLLLADTNDSPTGVVRCLGGKERRCRYAINPWADPCSAPDVVLLFECREGWNRFGGPEILTARWRRGKSCTVLFVNGDVEFIATEDIPLLRWEGRADGKVEESSSVLRNARRPKTRKELEYWLKNMVWYHRFTTDEIVAATGLDAKVILAVQKESGIVPGSRPARNKQAPVLVLPYPGGRHPRIGFLEGAIDPQRETKFSVFTPWDPNSYVVVDVPEAIWSNLGLTYLAHTHIDTIWTKQGIELPKLEWNRRPDGSLDIERTLPNGIVFGVKAMPAKDAVRMEMWLKNGTDRRLTDLRVQMCVMAKMAAGFAEQTNKNKVFTNPYVACQSTNGKRWIITAWEGCQRPWGNEQCPCFHSDPKFPDLAPGRRHRLRGWLSFYEGNDIQGEFARIEATGWRRD